MEKGYQIDALLMDTGIIYALADSSDSWHKRAADFLYAFRGRLITSSMVIPEACYLLNTYLGQSAEIAFIDSLRNKEIEIEHVSIEDIDRSLEIIKKYDSLNLGFVDASLMAIAERLKICKILTTDRRHFSLLKPKHCNSFTLLP